METKDTLSSCSNLKEQQMQQIQDKAKESCMVSYRLLHSHLKLLSNNDLKGNRIEYGFKRAFATLFVQDLETFTGTMFLNMDQLEKQLDNKEFQEIRSMASFKVLETQFQMFIKSRIYLDDEYIVTRNYFLQYTQLEIPEFLDILIQYMESVKKSIDKREIHKREYDSRVNERQMQTTKGKVDTCKALDASLVNIERNIRPIYDEEPMAEVQITAKINVFAIGQQHTEQPEFNNEGEVDQNADNIMTHIVVKPHHVIASSESRNSSKNMSRFSSNDMVHNHYLEEAKKKIQECGRNSRPSVMPSARSQITTNGSKPKPRINNQKSRNWPASKSSCVTTKTVSIAEHSRNSRINSRAKVSSNKTTKRYIPVEQTSFAKKPERQIPKRHRSSIKKTSIVHEKTITPRSCLRWKLTGKLFKTVGLMWIPTRNIFTSSTTKVDSDPTNGSDEDITNQYECEQTLDVSVAMTSDHNSSELGIHDHSNELSSSKLVPKVVPPADKTATSRQELELLFHHHITMLRLVLTEPKDSYKDGDGDTSFQLKSDSLPHAHTQTTKTYYKHQDSRIMKAQELKTKTSVNSDINDNSSEIKLRGRLLASFLDDAKYEHVGQDTRSQGGKDDQD
ncbi:hypothetical protein Tco_0286336 [Tanacetum coccineum]